MKAISEAVKYIESHITENITIYEVAEYVRNRRMALAREELITSDISIMELAMKYGYDSPDSFTKAFSRFHGYTPLAVRRDKTMIKLLRR